MSWSEDIKKLSFKMGKISNKDLANELRKIAAEVEEGAEVEKESDEIKAYRQLLNKMKGKESLNKLKIFIDNARTRKPITWWLTAIDKGEGAGAMEVTDMMTEFKKIITRDLPAARFLKLVLDYGRSEGWTKLNRILEQGLAKITLTKEAK